MFFSFTHHSFLSEEDVESGNILIPSIISSLSNLEVNCVNKGVGFGFSPEKAT